MGIGITQEQRELAEAVRGWVARTVPPEEVRKLLDSPPPTGVRPDWWDALAAQGLLAPHLEGGTLLDLAVVVEEAARGALPGPFLPSALASALLHRAGADELAAALADGSRIGAVALGPGSMTAVAAAVEGGGHLLDGTAPPVLGAGEADLVLLAAEAADGTLWFAVDAAALDIRTHDSADPTRPTAEVRARGVAVPPGRLLALDAATVRDLACALFAADACGTAAWAVHTAAEYAKVREQFGRPIGRFQGVKHLCADMLVRLEQARALAWDAARAMGGAPGGAGSGSATGSAAGSVNGPAAGVATGPGAGGGIETASGAGGAAGGAGRTDGAAGAGAGAANGPASRAANGPAAGAATGPAAGDATGPAAGDAGGPAVRGEAAEAEAAGAEAARVEAAEAAEAEAAPAEAARARAVKARALVVAFAVGVALDAAWSCAKDCIQVLGGIGFTWEHDAHLYLRRALVARQLLGAADGHRLRAVRLAADGARRELRLELPAGAEAYR
ncbi:acyl-CoA dehydrogenase, partial [Streptomyces bambusae]|uniref:acyl-CoA dehydrogenase n=1 Tax=Streptomyces bambusae TaxID=1550616 RepID=UPI002155D741